MVFCTIQQQYICKWLNVLSKYDLMTVKVFFEIVVSLSADALQFLQLTDIWFPI